MDAEDAHRMLTQTRLRCLILEADRDAEILRAGKYRKIIDSLAGEGGHGATGTQPQAAGISHMPRRASSLTEGQAESTITQCPSVRPPVAGRSCPTSDRTAAAVPVRLGQAHSVCLLCHSESFVNLIDAG